MIKYLRNDIWIFCYKKKKLRLIYIYVYGIFFEEPIEIGIISEKLSSIHEIKHLKQTKK